MTTRQQQRAQRRYAREHETIAEAAWRRSRNAATFAAVSTGVAVLALAAAMIAYLF